MHKSHRIWIIILAALLLACCFACKKTGGTPTATGETVDFDFTRLTNGIPEGWSVNSYEKHYALLSESGAIGVDTHGEDDFRFVQRMNVEPNAYYLLRAEIRTEDVAGGQGASLSIDNYSVDGSFIYSEGLFGTNDWTPVTLAFRTAESQKSVTLALRIGGYSSESAGKVWFRNVRFGQASGDAGEFLQLVPDHEDPVPVELSELSDWEVREYNDKIKVIEDYYNGFFTAIFLAGAVAAIVLQFGIWPRAKRLALLTEQKSRRYLWFAAIVAVGLIARVLLCAKYRGHDTDIRCWSGWGSKIAAVGTHAFYVNNWCDYPPGYMAVCGLLYRIEQVLPKNPEWMRIFVYMVPPFLCDVLSGLLILLSAKRFGIGDRLALLLAGLIVLNPAILFLSGAWGQIDSVLTLMLIGTFLLLNESRKKPYYRLLAGLLYGLAILTKWQALLVGPVLALMYVMTAVDQYRTKRFKAHILWTAAAVGGALFVLLLGTLLFRGENMSMLWLVERYLGATDGYNYASVEGYNFLTLFGGNWARLYIDDEAAVRVPLAMFGDASVGEIFLRCNVLFSRVALLIGFPTLIMRAWNEMRTRKDGGKNRAFFELVAVGIATALCGLIYFVAGNHTSSDAGAQALQKAFAAFPLYGVLMLAVFAYLVRRECGRMRLLDWIREGGAAATGALTMFAAVCAFGFTFLLAAAFKIFGSNLTWITFGVIGIVTAGILTVGLFLIYWKKHRAANRSLTRNRGLIFLLSAFFLVLVFTFGHKMHERYVLPVLFFLTFAYAYDRDPNKLAALCMLSVTTFMNEMVAMFVVSRGSTGLLEAMVPAGRRYLSVLSEQMPDFILHRIRGGETHNQMVALISLLEVAAALFFVAVCVQRALAFDPKELHPEEDEQ